MTGLVGRADELAILRGAIDDLRQGTSSGLRFLSLAGDPGIGKSSLLAALRRFAQDAGLRVLAGTATEDQRGTPFGPLVEALDDHVATLPFRAIASERYLRHKAIRALLERIAAAERQPFVLILDDVHWADNATAELLDYLRRHPTRAAILLALAYRPRQLDAPLAAALASNPRVLHLTVGPLDDDAARTLLGGTPLASTERATLLAAAEGNPLYLEALRRAAPDHQSRPRGADEVPLAVRTAVLVELAHMPVEVRTAAEICAVTGEPIDPDLVAETGDLDVAQAGDLVAELVARDLIRADAEDRLRFRHPLVRKAIYHTASPVFRLSLHARAAEALERRGESAARRAHHVEHSARRGDHHAADVLREAATAVVDVSPRTAAGWYGAAAHLLTDDLATARRRADLALARAQALASAGDLPASRSQLHDLMRDLGTEPTPARTNAVRVCAMVERLLGRHEQARALLLRELPAIELVNAPEATDLVLELAVVEYQLGAFLGSRDQGERALTLARQHHRQVAEVAAAGFLATSLLATDQVDQSLALVDATTKVVDRLSDAELMMRPDSLYWLSVALGEQDRFASSVRYTDRGIALARATGRGYVLVDLLSRRASSARRVGPLDEAAEAAEEALEAALLTQSDALRCQALYHQSWIASRQDDVPRCLALAAEFGPLAASMGGVLGADYGWRYWCLQHRAGHPDPVTEMVRVVGGPDAPRLDLSTRPALYSALVTLEIHRGDVATAQRWAERCEKSASPKLPGRIADVSYARAEVALARGDAAIAAEHAVTALHRTQKTGDRYTIASCELLAGQAWAAAGDRDEAVRRLESGLETATAYGSRQLRRVIAFELRRLGRPVGGTGPRGSGAHGPAALTRRELEVAHLLGGGLTNRQIAAELRLSHRTVEGHVASIFGKLGVASRSEFASAWVLQR